jgi:hypothetical protein
MTEIRQYLSQQKYTIDAKTKAWEKNLREVEKKFLLKS